MLRHLLAVIGGYVVLFLLVMGSFTVAYLFLGTEGSFQEGSYLVSTTWIVVSFVLSFFAAFVGGCICRVIARSMKGPLILAGVVFVLGILFAVPTILQPQQGSERTGEVSNFDAMQKAQQPPWIAFLNPFVGAAAVLLGGSRKKSGTV